MEPGVKQDILEGYKEAVLEFHGLCRQSSELRTKRDEAEKRLAEITGFLERHIKANLKDPTSVGEGQDSPRQAVFYDSAPEMRR